MTLDLFATGAACFLVGLVLGAIGGRPRHRAKPVAATCACPINCCAPPRITCGQSFCPSHCASYCVGECGAPTLDARRP